MDNFIDLIAEKDNYIRLKVNSKVYPFAIIFAAGYTFLDRVYIVLDKDKKGNIFIYLSPQKKTKDLKKIGLEFFNEMLNYSHYFFASETNSETIKLILQRALFSVNPSMVQEVEDQYIDNLINEELGNNKKNAKTVSLKKR
tara:strand:- start:532 stop:954 length:423 start_codon:yes stop_codon:yes gene_type:complete